jgi:hypothetical protein
LRKDLLIGLVGSFINEVRKIFELPHGEGAEKNIFLKDPQEIELSFALIEEVFPKKMGVGIHDIKEIG